MNFLRGMMDIIPDNGINVKAIRKLTKEAKSYNGRTYYGRFEFNETFTCKHFIYGHKVNASYGYIKLRYENCKFYQIIEIYGHCEYGFIPRICVRKELWAWNIKRISKKMFNEEVEKFRQAFLNNDPIVHNQIRAAILQSMGKPICDRCLDEKTENHACA